MSEFDLDIRITEAPQGTAEPANTIGGPGIPGCPTRGCTFFDCTYFCSWRCQSDDCTEVTCASECATCWPGAYGVGPQCV